MTVAPSNPVSAPNVALASRPGQLTYEEPVTATFAIGGLPAVVDDVALTMTDSTSPSRLEAYDPGGTLLGSATGGASATLRVAFPGQIHSVVIRQGPMAFDDFTFTGLAPVPEPTAAAIAASAAAAQLLRRRRRQPNA